MKIRTICATRYVTPLREGGSLPAIIEADDDGLYVLKFRGAGQGVKALIAELIAGELGRSAGLLVPEIVFVTLDPELARTEPDPEIKDLIKGSAGLNIALDYLPGSIAFDTIVEKPDNDFAASLVWFDAYITNVDRTPRNTNLLVWHHRTWLIDHGAAFYFHHNWKYFLERSRDPFPQIKDHVLLRFAKDLHSAHSKMTNSLNTEIISAVVNLIPDAWLDNSIGTNSIKEVREIYTEYLCKRLEHSDIFLEEAIRARS